MAIKGKKKLLRVTAIVLAIVLSVLALIALCAEISTRICDKWEPWRPTYSAMSDKDLSAILDKEALTEEDYQTLYVQTGLTKIGIDRLIQKEQKSEIISIHRDYFANYKVVKERFAPFTCWEKIKGIVGLVALEPGDIILTSATHVLGWRYGHTALVVNEYEVIESFAVGTKSDVTAASMIQDYASFMVLRPKVSEQTKTQIVDYALSELMDIPYALTTGIFSKKNQKNIDRTHCAHLVWYAYKQFGIDLDSNGGKIVKPQDIANSEHLEVVQIYGFHPEKLWN